MEDGSIQLRSTSRATPSNAQNRCPKGLLFSNLRQLPGSRNRRLCLEKRQRLARFLGGSGTGGTRCRPVTIPTEDRGFTGHGRRRAMQDGTGRSRRAFSPSRCYGPSASAMRSFVLLPPGSGIGDPRQRIWPSGPIKNEVGTPSTTKSRAAGDWKPLILLGPDQ